MTKLLEEIQSELADIESSLNKGQNKDILSRIHYLHAYIESRRQGMLAEPAEAPALEAEELVTA